MTSREEIERLLNKTGRTLDGLPEFYPEEQAMALWDEVKAKRELWENRVLHQSDVIELLVAALRDALDKQPKWISVEERLPEDRRHVNVIFDDGFRTLGYMQNMKWYVAGALYEQYGIKYWALLPEPPKAVAITK